MFNKKNAHVTKNKKKAPELAPVQDNTLVTVLVAVAFLEFFVVLVVLCCPTKKCASKRWQA